MLKEQFTRVVLANRSIVYSVGPVPYFIDHEGEDKASSVSYQHPSWQRHSFVES